MYGAIDTTLGAISIGTVHSRVGACDPRGLFAKRVLHDDSHHTLAIASLTNSFNSCATAKKFLRSQNAGKIRLRLAARGSLVPATLRICGSSWSRGTFSICVPAAP